MGGKKKFIILGDVRIRVNNIKNYGISSKQRAYEKIYTLIEEEYNRSGLSKRLLGKTGYKRKLEWNGELELLDDDRYEELEKASRNSSSDRNVCYKLYRKKGSEEIRGFNRLDVFSVNGSISADMRDVVFRKDKYLYITTFQRDNYVFFDCEEDFDISDKCRELDGLVNGET